MSLFRKLVGLFGCVMGVAACGASTAGTQAHGASSEGASAEPDSEQDVDVSTGSDAEESAPQPLCSDETCFACGDGLCPSGFYCDEGAVGGAACAWLPDCAKTPTCECVVDVLGSDCQCEKRDAHVFVSCGT